MVNCPVIESLLDPPVLLTADPLSKITKSLGFAEKVYVSVRAPSLTTRDTLYIQALDDV